MTNDLVIKKINDIIEATRIYIRNDGGDVKFISYNDGILTLQICGACVGCPHIDTTFELGIKSIIKDEVPEVKEVNFII